MNKQLKTLAIAAITLATTLQATAAEPAVLVPTVDPITGKIVYILCPTYPHCDYEHPPVANLKPEE